MAQVTATTSRTIAADPETVRTAVADYREVRPRILTEHYRDYRVDAGGQGAGTIAHWILQATSKRSRDQDIEVSSNPAGDVVERDRNSSMVTTWSVRPDPSGSPDSSDSPSRSAVTVDTRWDGASGIGGFFERMFAPKGLQRIHGGVLANLARQVGDDST